jgi:diguanylate cyclase (GGDEF)-like protein/PAS domain S-box-containing protein
MGMFEPVKRWLIRRTVARGASDERAFREMAQHSSDMLCRIGADGSGKYFSPASFSLFGWTPEEMVAMNPADFFFPEDLPTLALATERLYLGKSTSEICEVRVMRRDGSMAWAETRTRVAPPAKPGEKGDLIVVLRDVTDRKQLEERLKLLATVDGLTGIANRRAFDERLQRNWQETLLLGAEMSLLLLDIDHFKEFNDCFGHQVGDDCLRAVATSVARTVKETDSLVARYGGEEFAIILPQASAGVAADVGEKVRAGICALEVPHPNTDQVTPFVTVSVGAATAVARHGGTISMPTGLIQAADRALYKAKNSGRNRVEISLVLTAGD